MSTDSESESEKYVTEDILIDVFLRLHIKSLLRCTSVCKTWHRIINSTSFANSHLSSQKTSSTTNRYVHQNPGSCTLFTDFVPPFDRTKHSKLYYTPELFERDINICDGCSLKIHGICDGLLCLSKNGISDDRFTDFKSEYCIGDNLHLWNPICRKAKKLPDLRISKEYDGFVRKGGVSFGHYDNDYKVIVISTISNRYDVSVYSLSTNCWNIIHTNCYYEDKIVDFCTVPEPTKFLDGIACMITDTVRNAPWWADIAPLTVCFDLKDETIQQFKCPEEFIKYHAQFAMEAYGETVAILGCYDDSGNLDMWILFRDNFSSKSRWEKKLVIVLREVGFSLPVGFLYDGKYLLSTTVVLDYREITNFYLYDLESQEVTEYGSSKGLPDYCSTINSNCVESLLLLNEDSVFPFVHKEMESSSSSMLFTLHNYLQRTFPRKVHDGRKQKSRKKKVKSLYDKGSAHGPEILELTEDDIAVKFASGLANVASVSLSISYPSIAAAPSMFNNAYKNVLALSVATAYSFKQAEEVKESLKVSKKEVESLKVSKMSLKEVKKKGKEEPGEELDNDPVSNLFK